MSVLCTRNDDYVERAGDYDGDGRADLFWCRSDGENYLYLVNSFTIPLRVGVASRPPTSTPVR